MTILHLVSTITFTLTLFHRAWTSITVWPNNVTVQANQSASLNCSTTSDAGVKWFCIGVPVPLCVGLECFDPYNQRFRVENITSTGSWNLIISSAKAEDAGEYICEEIGFASDKGSVQLTVSGIEENEATGGKTTIDLPYIATLSDTATTATADVTNAGGIIAAIIGTILGILVLIVFIIVIVWLVKKYRLQRQQGNKTDENQRLTRDDVYTDQPTLVRTIKTRSAVEKNSYIRAVAVFKLEVFLATDNCREIEVYDVVNLDLKRCFTIDQLTNPLDIKPCLKNNCLYIFDCVFVGQPGKILKIKHDRYILEWPMEDSGARLSVASNGNIIVSLWTNNKIVEYKSDGRKVREIKLHAPRHAILLRHRQILISQGHSDDDELHRVFQLRLEDGVSNVTADQHDVRIIKSVGGERGPSVGQMNVPWYMAVDENGWILVAERENQRVTLFSPTLEFKRILISETDGLRRPLNMFMDMQRGRIFVTDFVWEGTKRVDGQLLVFKIRNPTNPLLNCKICC